MYSNSHVHVCVHAIYNRTILSDKILTSLLFCTVDQLNTSVHATMKTTPFELAFGQPPRTNIFPGAVGIVMEEDIAELLDEGTCTCT